MNEVDQAMLIVREIKDEWYQQPNNYYSVKKELFELRSYQRWALDEIEQYLSKHPYEHPIESLETFRYNMDFAATETKSAAANFAFSVAVDVVLDVLDILKASI